MSLSDIKDGLSIFAVVLSILGLLIGFFVSKALMRQKLTTDKEANERVFINQDKRLDKVENTLMSHSEKIEALNEFKVSTTIEIKHLRKEVSELSDDLKEMRKDIKDSLTQIFNRINKLS